MLVRTASKNLLEHVSLGPMRQDKKSKLVSLPSFLGNENNVLGGSDVYITGLVGWRWKKADEPVRKHHPNQGQVSVHLETNSKSGGRGRCPVLFH